MKSLILTVTRQCNLRCSYCPTAKDGWPTLSAADARTAVRLFSDRFGGGNIKVFGGEPLLAPDSVRAAMEEARDDSRISWVYLSTNGLGLNDDWLDYLEGYPKGVLTLSLDGTPEDHRRHRRAVDGTVPDTYDHVMKILPRLLETPRMVVTQTIPPATASRASRNFEHLLQLGFWRFNFLPGYYLPWRTEQLTALHENFNAIRDRIIDRWRANERTYVRNLFTWAPTPFFNTGLVVDADRTIHPSNIGLSGALDHLRGSTVVGDLDAPPSPEALAEAARGIGGLLESALEPKVLKSTQAVDVELSGFCRALYPHWARWRRGRPAA